MVSMIVALGSDHAGYAHKEAVQGHLRSLGHTVLDCGTDSADACDYPDYIRPAALAVANGEADRGIVFGGSGNGEAIVANRVKGIRCAVCWSEETAALARRHNDANMISLGERLVPLATALRIVDLFLTEPFDGGRHARRVAKIDEPY